MAKRKEIRNSTAEFLIFQADDKGQGIEVIYKDENVWCTQKSMATLFDVNIPAISKHLKNIFDEGELVASSTVSKMEIVQTEGTRQVKRETVFYNLDAIISVGYRVNSIRATQFRQWATSVLRQFFFDSKDFEDAIRLTVSLGGDADTMGAITGPVAAAYYKEIPRYLCDFTLEKLPNDLREIVDEFEEKYCF